MELLCSTVPGAYVLAACISVLSSLERQGLHKCSRLLGVPAELVEELSLHAFEVLRALKAPELSTEELRSLVDEAVKRIEDDAGLACLDQCKMVINYQHNVLQGQAASTAPGDLEPDSTVPAIVGAHGPPKSGAELLCTTIIGSYALAACASVLQRLSNKPVHEVSELLGLPVERLQGLAQHGHALLQLLHTPPASVDQLGSMVSQVNGMLQCQEYYDPGRYDCFASTDQCQVVINYYHKFMMPAAHCSA